MPRIESTVESTSLQWRRFMLLLTFVGLGATLYIPLKDIIPNFWVWTALVAIVIIVTLTLQILHVSDLSRKRRYREDNLLKEKADLVREKEEQQRYYANLIHEVIKGEAQSMLEDVIPADPVYERLIEFIKTCELSQSFIDTQNNDLFDLMNAMGFIFSNRLHSEMREQYFYCDIDPSLKGIHLGYRQKYELIFFLRECLNNIRKYAHYKHVGLNIHLKKNNNQLLAGSEVVLEIKDDGMGLQGGLGMVEEELEINVDNVQQFREQYLKGRRCTGIDEIFRKSFRMKGDLVIRSIIGQGTQVKLRFFPNSG